MNADTLRALCPAPGQGYDWAACCEAIPRLHALETTPQSPRYHAYTPKITTICLRCE